MAVCLGPSEGDSPKPDTGGALAGSLSNFVRLTVPRARYLNLKV